MTSKFYGFLGLCAKAGKVQSGAFAAEKAIKQSDAKLVIVADDASANTKSDYTKLCNGYGATLVIYGDKASLGRAIGKDERVALVITDEKMAEALVEKMKENSEE